MTIGPEPSTRIRRRSSRLGMAGGLPDLGDEVVEEVQRVVRPGPRLRVVLDAPGGDVERPDALDGAVVEVEARELHGAVVGLTADRRVLQAALDGEAVVLRGDG